GKDTPDSGPEAQSMPQNLEDDVSMIGAVAMPAKRGQTQSVRGVVRQIESAFQGERPVLCVVQSRLGSAHQAREFARIRYLRLERPIRTAEILQRRGHPCLRTARPWLATACASRMRSRPSCAWPTPSLKESLGGLPCPAAHGHPPAPQKRRR